MTILIIEPFVQGHHGAYLSWIIRAILSAGIQFSLRHLKKAWCIPPYRIYCPLLETDSPLSVSRPEPLGYLTETSFA